MNGPKNSTGRIRPARPNDTPLAAVRRRVISGLIFALPIAITFWIVYWLVSTLQGLVLDPVAYLIRRVARVELEHIETLPWWWKQFLSPLMALTLVVVFLYFLGYFGRSKLYRGLDWLLLHVPFVTVIYKAVRNVFASLNMSDTGSRERFKRVVLIPFPSREVRTPAFVTRTARDEATGRNILYVFVAYSPLPTTGLVFLVPEDEVVELDWDVNQTMQALISMGITTPATIAFDGYSPDPRESTAGRSTP
jgi:uncharacterized membrane protein